MTEVIEKAKVLMDQLPEGPWRWCGYHDDVKLCTSHSGTLYLMGVARCGFGGAQFTFQNFKDPKGAETHYWDRGASGIQKGWPDVYQARAPYDPKNIADINHPLAQLIKMLPEVVEGAARSEADRDWAFGLLVQFAQEFLFFDKDEERRGDHAVLFDPPAADLFDYDDALYKEMYEKLAEHGYLTPVSPGFWNVVPRG